MGLMWRPGLVVQEVATWEQCRDLAWGRLPRPVATSARPACVLHARDKLAVRAAAPTTWALSAQCARDLGSGCVHCAPNPVFVTVHCLGSLFGHCSWTLFKNPVHRVKKNTKFLKIFLGVI